MSATRSTTPAETPSPFMVLGGLIAALIVTALIVMGARLIYGVSWLAGAAGNIIATGAKAGWRAAVPFSKRLQTSVNRES